MPSLENWGARLKSSLRVNYSIKIKKGQRTAFRRDINTLCIANVENCNIQWLRPGGTPILESCT